MPRTPRETVIRKLKAIKRHAEWVIKHANDIRLLFYKDVNVEWTTDRIVLEIGVNASEICRLVDHVLDALGYKPRVTGGRSRGEEA